MTGLSRLFEQGQYWDTFSYLFYLAVGILFSALIHCSINFRMRKGISSGINIFEIAAFLLVFSVLAFRSEDVGVDTRSYSEMFSAASFESIDLIEGLSFNSTIEPLFVCFESLVKLFSEDFRALLVAEAAVISSCLMVFVRHFFDEKTSCIPLVLVSNYILFAMALTRSALATSIIMIALVQSDIKKNRLSVVFAILACYIHYSMIVILPFFILRPFVNRILAREKFVQFAFVGIAAALFTILIFLFSDRILASTKYFYKETNEISVVSYWYVALIALAIIALHKRSDWRNDAYGTVLLFVMYEIITLPGLMLAGVYRVERYYMLARMAVWGKLPNLIRSGHAVLLFKLALLAGCIFYTYVYSCNTSEYVGFAFAWM